MNIKEVKNVNADIRDNLMDLIEDRCCVQASIARNEY
nr:MAG TPA: hypothetical protein [Caudoviricetes sp.]